MEKIAHHWKRIPSIIRKPLVLIAGVFLVILGIILIPLPGPGLLVTFVGLALLATEFSAAEKLRDQTLVKLKNITAKAHQKTDDKTPKKTPSKLDKK